MVRIGSNPPKTEIIPEDLKISKEQSDAPSKKEEIVERLIPKGESDKAKASKNAEKNLEGQLNRAILEQVFAKALGDPGFTPKPSSDQGLGDPGFTPKGGRDERFKDVGFTPQAKSESESQFDLPIGDPGFVPKSVSGDKGLGDPGFIPKLKPKNEPEPQFPNNDSGFTPRGGSEKGIGDPGFSPKVKPDTDRGDPGFIPKLKK